MTHSLDPRRIDCNSIRPAQLVDLPTRGRESVSFSIAGAIERAFQTLERDSNQDWACREFIREPQDRFSSFKQCTLSPSRLGIDL